MHDADITALEHQASHRATTANQAWAWAKAIEHLAHNINGTTLAHRTRPASPLAWLECEMAWTCEDLEDAGAWPCDLNLVSDPDPLVAVRVAARWLNRLTGLAAVDPDVDAAVHEAQARARACLRGLAEATSIAMPPARAA